MFDNVHALHDLLRQHVVQEQRRRLAAIYAGVLVRHIVPQLWLLQVLTLTRCRLRR